ncbi:MAG: hypothetical protein AABY64_03965 [Bdellovibrionota bacterium]|mgnify:CR=1 FL=1
MQAWTSGGKLLEQEADHTEEAKIKLSRHDNHNLELKSSFYFLDKKIKADLDLFLFVPKTVHLKSWNKTELTSDFFSRQRLSIPPSETWNQDDISAKILQLKNILLQFSTENNADEVSALSNELVVLCRSLGAYTGEVVKAGIRRIPKELFLLYSRTQNQQTSENSYNKFTKKLDQIKSLVDQLREITNSKEALNIPVIQLLEQYIHHLFVESLAYLKDEHERMFVSAQHASSLTFRIGRDAFSEKLKTLLNQESYYQKKHHTSLKDMSEKSQSELLIVRLGQMKKFFQSEMFINVSKKHTLKRFVEPASAMAAAFAALIGGIAQYYSRPGSVSLGGVYIILIWMALYVVRDRVKDHGKAFLTEKISSYLPDVEENLDAENRGVGKIKEWFRIIPDSQVSEKTRRIRKSACVSEAEGFLPEDVIHFKRSFTLKGIKPSEKARLSLQENLRINLERYLKYLDDPQKEICLLNEDGEFSRITSNKVYYFYLVANLNFENNLMENKHEIYRIILTKQGIQKVVLANEIMAQISDLNIFKDTELRLIQDENQRSLLQS